MREARIVMQRRFDYLITTRTNYTRRRVARDDLLAVGHGQALKIRALPLDKLKPVSHLFG